MSEVYKNHSITRGKSYEGDEDITRITLTVQVQGSDTEAVCRVVELLDLVVEDIKHGL